MRDSNPQLIRPKDENNPYATPTVVVVVVVVDSYVGVIANEDVPFAIAVVALLIVVIVLLFAVVAVILLLY